jgi:serine/threonine-protein phosphatase Stp1
MQAAFSIPWPHATWLNSGAPALCNRLKKPAVEPTIRSRTIADLTDGLSVAGYAATHIGLVRKVNEDAILDRSEIGLWAVADGVGGGYAGDRASGLIVASLEKLPVPVGAVGFVEDVRRSLDEVNRRLRTEAAVSGDDRVIASTVVCLLHFERWYCCLWAGDSRLYRLKAGNFEQLTRDHSEVQSLLDYGLISVEEARQHPRANVVTRAVGAEDVLQLQTVEGEIEPGDAFLLCTDGLTKVVEDWEISIALSVLSAPEAVHSLIGMTLQRGAPDNVSVAVIKFARNGHG